MVLLLAAAANPSQVHSSQDSAQLVELIHLVLRRPPQSLHVRLYHCRYLSMPESVNTSQDRQHIIASHKLQTETCSIVQLHLCCWSCGCLVH